MDQWSIHVFSVYCSAHGCRLYSARRLLKTDALALLIEDQAPGHIGDTDTYLAKQDAPNASGWKHERVVELRKLKVHRCIIPRHGTPVLCVNDQLHGWVHREIKADLSEQVGLGQDLCSRPKGRAARPFFTAGGSRRGPDEIMMARALFRVASRLTRFQVCCASRKYAVALVVDSWFVRLLARVARIYFMLAFVLLYTVHRSLLPISAWATCIVARCRRCFNARARRWSRPCTVYPSGFCLWCTVQGVLCKRPPIDFNLLHRTCLLYCVHIVLFCNVGVCVLLS